MSTTARIVERHLEMDTALADTITRGIANYRRTARWLLKEYGWNATEDAVVSALRRYHERTGTSPMAPDREMLSSMQVDLRTGLSLLTLSRTRALFEHLGLLWSEIEPLSLLGVLPARQRIRLLLETGSLSVARSAIPDDCIEGGVLPISAIQLTFPAGADGGSLVSYVIGSLVRQGTRVHDVFTCLPECSILVPDSQTSEAYEIVAALAGE